MNTCAPEEKTLSEINLELTKIFYLYDTGQISAEDCWKMIEEIYQ